MAKRKALPLFLPAAWSQLVVRCIRGEVTSMGSWVMVLVAAPNLGPSPRRFAATR